MSSDTSLSALSGVKRVLYPSSFHPVECTTAETLCSVLSIPGPEAVRDRSSGLLIGLAGGAWRLGPDMDRENKRPWIWIRIGSDGEGEIAASVPAFLYAAVSLLRDGLVDASIQSLRKGLFIEPAFSWNRPLFDQTLTQTARTTRFFDADSYVRTLAMSGFTHLEVNGLATHVPIEPGVPNEFYSPFYTYCPGLNQFVDSDLTRGISPNSYLRANLNRLKKMAALGRRYGLKPGLLCFEPRTLPETFFHRYPALRGARVDHPFRSRLPRYTLAQDHPSTREHYRQLVQKLQHEVPELAYLSVWSNDSGAGFEHTASLYVGRNGGPFLIREWHSEKVIAEAAGRSALRFLRLLQETATDTNPDFEVSLRIEPFKVEHDTLWEGMGRGLTIEAPSLLVRGYDLPYHHPRYPEQKSIAGSIFHTHLTDEEQDKLKACRNKGFEPILNYAPGSAFNMEPLLGIPFPRLLHQKLIALNEAGFERISAVGGLLNTDRTPFWPNPEVIRAVQFFPSLSLDEILVKAAARWADDKEKDYLVSLWYDVDETVSYLPIVPLYSHFGFVWLRTWVRPLVPNIEAIPPADRQYYEQFMVSTPNNPAINDLGKDVLFELISESSGRSMAQQFDVNVLPRLKNILDNLSEAIARSGQQATKVYVDLYDRVAAFHCWSTTQRNTCAWVAGVYGYLNASTEAERARHRTYASEMVSLEIDNARSLLQLWKESKTEFMLISDVGETSFIYGDNFGELLQKKSQLMEQYGGEEPQIDRDIIWRLA